MTKPIKAVMGEAAFRALCRGGEVTIKDETGQAPDVHIILSDVGFPALRRALADAEVGVDHYKGVTTDSHGEVLRQ